MSSFLPLNANDEVRTLTCKPAIFESAVINSSLTPSLRGEDFLEKTLEARIASQWIENRIDFDFKREPVAFFTGLCKPGEGLLLVTQPHVGTDVLNGWDVLAARGLFFDSLELFLCQCVNGSVKARLGISAFEERGILIYATEVQSFAPFPDSLFRHILFFVRIAQPFMGESPTRIELQCFAILIERGVVLPHKEKESRATETKPGRQRIEIECAPHLGKRFFIAAEQNQTERVVSMHFGKVRA